jgi:hypothetical protein
MPDSERPDLKQLRHHLRWLFLVIAVVVAGLVALTLYLYARFTAGVTVTP